MKRCRRCSAVSVPGQRPRFPRTSRFRWLIPRDAGAARPRGPGKGPPARFPFPAHR